ncbi:MAG: methionine synthase [Deltaproteobacteria bacterium]|nr:methionine synthase [Deltaproteobacteria bacterium]
MNAHRTLETLLRHRIVVLDGAMGTMIQRCGLDESAYRGPAFADHPRDLKGCNDLLCLTQPEVIEKIHRQFLEAGADIVETNTFNAQAISLADYGLEAQAYPINRAAAELARRAAATVSKATPERPRFVAGSLGPTTRSASLSPDVNDPAARSVTFDQLVRAYHEQVRGLIDGGVDLLLPETTFDTLNLKAALFAIQRFFDEGGRRVPVLASLTITDASGRVLSGQTLEACWISIRHAPLFAVGLNCALGASQMRAHVEELSALAPIYLACYPNAGLPNELGGYDESPAEMAAVLREYAREGWLNLAGGCCGTTPEHIRAIADAVAGLPPRLPPPPRRFTELSGLEPLVVRPDSNLVMVGERTNVAGSRKFAKLVLAGDFEGALAIARDQVAGGANVLDVNMDEGMLDSVAAMRTFLNLVGSEPEVARLPIMIDSSKFEVLEAGLQCLQGKGVVNSISLKEGEETFRAHARLVHRYGAAVVVMAFDEEGQAVTVEHKLRIARRAHRILTEEVGFRDEDIIFDPNILTVGTGMEEHDDYAVAFLEATRQIKQALPGVKVSGGVSNISFAFRSNLTVREAMHAAFLYHAIRAGLDLAIVNAGQLAVYEEIPAALLEQVEDVLLNRRPDATERLIQFAATVGAKEKEKVQDEAWRGGSVRQRLAHALIHGVVDFLPQDLDEALRELERPIAIIEGPLMDGMNVVGDLFGAGKMFLPQVVKSARAMKKAVAHLLPLLDAERQGQPQRSAGKIVLATVKGDVHDIGKNIVGVVLGCNSYEILDLGVMVSADKILETAEREGAQVIGLSGLITPSLDEMVHVAHEMERRGLRLPLLIGGATTSKKHTAVRVAPKYRGPTVHVADASRAVGVLGALLNADLCERFVDETRADQARIRTEHEGRGQKELVPFADAVARREPIAWSADDLPAPSFLGVRAIRDQPLGELVPYIDWTPFFHAWELRGVFPALLDDLQVGPAARELYQHAQTLLQKIVDGRWLTARGVYGFFPAAAVGDDLELYPDASRAQVLARLHTLRQQRSAEGRPCLALADFVAPKETGLRDHLGAFAVTTGLGQEELVGRFERDHDDYQAILTKALADRLAEAFAEKLHEQARREWGYGQSEQLAPADLVKERYRGIRPAPGYPACPDHTEKRTLFELLGAEEATGITLTESYAMHPAASVCGLYFAHPTARYFAVGPIGRDQVQAYAARKGLPVAQVERWLGPNLGYEP